MPQIHKNKTDVTDLPGTKEVASERSKVGRGMSFEEGAAALAPKESSGHKKGGALGALTRGIKDAGKSMGHALGLGKGKDKGGKGGAFGLADPARTAVIENAIGETDTIIGMAANIAKRSGLIRNEMKAKATDDYDATEAYAPALLKLQQVAGSLGQLNAAQAAALAAFDNYRATGDEAPVVQALKTFERVAIDVRIGICGLAGPGDSVSIDGFMLQILKPVYGGVQVGPKDAKAGKFDTSGKLDKDLEGSGQLPQTDDFPSSKGITNYGKSYMQYVDAFRVRMAELG